MTDVEADIAEYVLGTLEPARRAELEARFAQEPALRAARDAWARRLAPLATATPAAAVPDDMWTRIARETVDGATPRTRTIARGTGEWTPIAPGVESQDLVVDAERGFKACLLRMAPGSSMPAHPHSGDEECLLVEGEISIGDLVLRAGDWHLAPRGLVHPEIRSTTGAVLYVRAALDEHRA